MCACSTIPDLLDIAMSDLANGTDAYVTRHIQAQEQHPKVLVNYTFEASQAPPSPPLGFQLIGPQSRPLDTDMNDLGMKPAFFIGGPCECECFVPWSGAHTTGHQRATFCSWFAG